MLIAISTTCRGLENRPATYCGISFWKRDGPNDGRIMMAVLFSMSLLTARAAPVIKCAPAAAIHCLRIIISPSPRHCFGRGLLRISPLAATQRLTVSTNYRTSANVLGWHAYNPATQQPTSDIHSHPRSYFIQFSASIPSSNAKWLKATVEILHRIHFVQQMLYRTWNR